MARTISEKNITRFDPTNIEDLTPTLVSRKFGRPEDYIDIFISDLNGNVIDRVFNYKDYKVPQTNPYGDLTNELDLDPKSILENRGFSSGTYKLHINIQKQENT